MWYLFYLQNIILKLTVCDNIIIIITIIRYAKLCMTFSLSRFSIYIPEIINSIFGNYQFKNIFSIRYKLNRFRVLKMN